MPLIRSGAARARWKRLPALVAAQLMIVIGGSAIAQEDPFANISGVAEGDHAPVGGVGRLAGMSVNPGRTGQVLIGAYFDVRATTDTGGAVDAQETIVTIRNESTPDAASNAYDPNGGVLLRLRLRESRHGLASANVDVVLGCGQSWTATFSLAEGGTPRIRSGDPVVQSLSASSVTTAALDGAGAVLTWSGGLDRPLDLQRGFIEVFASEALPCRPVDPPISRSGNQWLRLGSGAATTPRNALSGDVAVVQVLRASAYAYAMTAVARHRIEGSGAATLSLPSTPVPSLVDCRGPTNSAQPSSYTGSPACIRQANFALSRSRLRVPFRSADGSSWTRVVLTLPTRPQSCLVANGSLVPAYAGTPYSCATAGEKVTTKVSDDLGDAGEVRTTRLERATTIVGVGPTRDPFADVWIRTNGVESGVLYVDLARSATGEVEHFERTPQADTIDYLGVGFAGFDGLPVVPLGLREEYSEFTGTTRAIAFRPRSEVAHVVE